MTYKVDWERAYKAWTASKLSEKKFYYSKDFKKFLIPGRMPTLATLEHHFRHIRKKLEPKSLNSVSVQQAKKAQTQVEVVDSQAVNVVQADKYYPSNLRKLLSKPNSRIHRLRQIAVRLPDGTAVEFETDDPELLVLKMIAVSKGERL